MQDSSQQLLRQLIAKGKALAKTPDDPKSLTLAAVDFGRKVIEAGAFARPEFAGFRSHIENWADYYDLERLMRTLDRIDGAPFYGPEDGLWPIVYALEGELERVTGADTVRTPTVPCPPAAQLAKGVLIIDGVDSYSLTASENDVLGALVKARAATKPELERLSGISDAVRVLRELTEKYDLAHLIRFPGSRGKGGYSTKIRGE